MVKPRGRRNICLSDKCPEFFKVYIPNHSSQQLRIPPAFVKHLDGVLSHKSILRSPDKRSWHVNVTKVDDNLFFAKGWRVFVEDNSLVFGDFLLFRYVGNSNFNVKLYGKNGCEKEVVVASRKGYVPLSDEENQKQEKPMKENQPRTKIGNNPPLQYSEARQRNVIHMKSPNGQWGLKGSAHGAEANRAEPEGSNIIYIDSDCTKEETGISSPNGLFRTNDFTLLQGDKKTEPSEFKQVMGKAGVGVTQWSSCSMVPVAIQENNRALKAASKFISEYPFFKVVMKPTYVCRGNLHIPFRFVKNYMEEGRHSVMLRVSDRSWSVNMVTYKDRAGMLQAGWIDFVRENTLHVGDVCIFELIERKDVLKVSIFRCLD